MRVILSAQARADLVAIGDFIAADNRSRAHTFVAELVACCRQLATMPRAYPVVPGYEDAGVRRRTYRDYVIFYRVGVDALEIFPVLHGARDYGAVLFPEK